MSSLERFLRKMEAKQDEAIDAVLDSSGGYEGCEVASREEACWDSVIDADNNETAPCSGGESPQPRKAATAALVDRQPMLLVKLHHRATPPGRGPPCSRCK